MKVERSSPTSNPAGRPAIKIEKKAADYERFERLTKALVAVPKEEARQEEKKQG